MSGNAHVKNAIFKELSPESSGGAIYCSGSSLLFLAEATSFLNCTPSGQGGALFLSITGESILSKICGFGCFSTGSSDQFDYIKVTSDASKRNELLDSSVCRCVQRSKNEMVRHNYGKVHFNDDNISLNECNCYSAIDSDNQNAESNEFGFTLEYSSIANNSASIAICILTSNANKKLISSCNILMNKHNNALNGIIHMGYETCINDSCILGNVGQYIIYVTTSTGTVSNCTLDFTSSSVSGASITNQASSSFINRIECFSTALCEAFYDSFGDLTVFPLKKTRKTVCTCKRKSHVWNAYLVIELITMIGIVTNN